MCGTCGDGWTAFCCTINSGRNSLPAGQLRRRLVEGRQRGLLLRRPPLHHRLQRHLPDPVLVPLLGRQLRRPAGLLQPVPLRPVPPGDRLLRPGRVPGRDLHAAVAVRPGVLDPHATDNATRTHGAACLTHQPSTPISQKYACPRRGRRLPRPRDPVGAQHARRHRPLRHLRGRAHLRQLVDQPAGDPRLAARQVARRQQHRRRLRLPDQRRRLDLRRDPLLPLPARVDLPLHQRLDLRRPRALLLRLPAVRRAEHQRLARLPHQRSHPQRRQARRLHQLPARSHLPPQPGDGGDPRGDLRQARGPRRGPRRPRARADQRHHPLRRPRPGLDLRARRRHLLHRPPPAPTACGATCSRPTSTTAGRPGAWATPPATAARSATVGASASPPSGARSTRPTPPAPTSSRHRCSPSTSTPAAPAAATATPRATRSGCPARASGRPSRAGPSRSSRPTCPS